MGMAKMTQKVTSTGELIIMSTCPWNLKMKFETLVMWVVCLQLKLECSIFNTLQVTIRVPDSI